MRAAPNGTPATVPRRGPDGVIAAALFIGTALVFAGAIANGFVNYDDPDYVTANPVVRQGLTWEAITWALTTPAASNWHPLTWWSHLLDVSLFGLSPAGHHATSVALHALNAALCFTALHRLTGARLPSLAVAVFFALHPLRVESVAWVAERKDVLSGAFFFACLYAYARYAGLPSSAPRRARWYTAALAAAALGLLAKPMLVTVPFVLLLLDIWPLRRCGSQPPSSVQPRVPTVRLLAEKMPFLSLSVVSSIITFLVQQKGGAVTAALSLPDRLANAAVAVVRYVGDLLWPQGLAVLYPHPGRWATPVVAGAVVVIVAASLVAVAQRQRRPWLAVGWFWFAGMLIPVLGIVQVGLQAMADRYTYLPSVGLGLAAVFTLTNGMGSAARRVHIPLAAGAAALAFMAVAQVRVWRDSVTLFTHTIAHAGAGNYLAYDNRGVALNESGRKELAARDYERALAINPAYPNANNNLGRLLAERGEHEAAIAHYRTALAAKPDEIEIHNNLANALADTGRIEEAIRHYQHVLARDPRHRHALNGYAVALASQGRLQEAGRRFRDLLDVDPGDINARSNLGNVYALLGQHDEAVRSYEEALRQAPSDARTWFNLGNVLLQAGRGQDAERAYRRAVQLAPAYAEAHAALGRTLVTLGRPGEAIPHLDTALRQQPGMPDAKAWLDAARAARP